MDDPKREARRIRLILIAAGLFGFLVFGGMAWWVRVESAELRTWEPVDATILEARVAEFEKRSDGVTRTYYEAVVRYEYAVAGTRYESTRITGSSSRSTSHEDQASRIKGYEAGAKVTAYVDPTDASKAVLRAEISPVFFPAFLAAAVLWLFLWGGIGWLVGRGGAEPQQETAGSDTTD